MTTSDAPAYKMTGEDEEVHALLAETRSRFTEAIRYLTEHGASNALAQEAASILSKPFLTTLRDLHHRIKGDAIPLVNELVISYVKAVAEACTISNLWRVVGPSSNNTLEYIIALRDNTLEHRTPLRDFRLDYEDNGFNELVPLVFHLIPEELGGDVISSEKIELV